jgi:hypothetical protein
MVHLGMARWPLGSCWPLDVLLYDLELARGCGISVFSVSKTSMLKHPVYLFCLCKAHCLAMEDETWKQSRGLGSTGELARLEAEASGSASARLPALGLFQQGNSQSSRAHLETRLASALVLESQAEYRRWLLTYARHLGGELRLKAYHVPTCQSCTDTEGPLSYLVCLWFPLHGMEWQTRKLTHKAQRPFQPFRTFL